MRYEVLTVVLLTIKSTAMWHCVTECIVLDFSKDGATFSFKGEQSKNNFSLNCLALEKKAPTSYEMSGTSHPLTQHHVPEDVNTRVFPSNIILIQYLIPGQSFKLIRVDNWNGFHTILIKYVTLKAPAVLLGSFGMWFLYSGREVRQEAYPKNWYSLPDCMASCLSCFNVLCGII